MKNWKRWISLLMVAAMVALAGCGNSGNASDVPTEEPSASGDTEESTETAAETDAENGDAIYFAVMGPMTGDAAQQGIQQERGVRLAVDEINANGGVNGRQLVYDVYDDQLNTNQAVICAEKIVAEEKYKFIVTSISTGCSKAAYPTWDDADLPVISGINTGNSITEMGFKNYLRVCQKDEANMQDMLDYMVNDCGVKHPAFLYSSADVDVTNFDFAKQYLKETYDIDVSDSAEFQAETEKDFTAHITNFKNNGVDGIYFCCEYNPAALFMKQKASYGWDVPVFGNSGCSNPLLIEVAGAENVEGFNVTSAFVQDENDERNQKFVADYTELAGVAPGEWAAGAYDAIYVMATALENEEAYNLNGNELVEWLRSNASYEGIMVKVEGFDENGDNPAASSRILTIKDGEFTIAK